MSTINICIQSIADCELNRVSTTINSNNHHSYAPFRIEIKHKKLYYHKEQYEDLYIKWGKDTLDIVLSYFNYNLILIPDNEWNKYWINIPLQKEITNKDIISNCSYLSIGDEFADLSLKNDIFCSIYKLYSAQFNYHHWIDHVRDAFGQQPVLRMFTNNEIELLQKISEERLYKGKSFTGEYLQDISNIGTLLEDLASNISLLYEMNKIFIDKILKQQNIIDKESKMEYKEGEEDFTFLSMLEDNNDDNINTDIIDNIDNIPTLNYPHNIPMFVKLCSSSAKNEVRPKPIYTVQEIIEFITGRFQFLEKDYTKYKSHHFNNPIGVVIMPWNSDINSKSEFRVFIRNRNLIALSQQAWYKIFYYTPEELEIAITCIYKLFEEKIKHNLHLPSAILDISVNFKLKNAFLIEINPWGTWATSGSALFDWVSDHNIIEPTLKVSSANENITKIYCRILHKIQYTDNITYNI